jgi:hypothetical protein
MLFVAFTFALNLSQFDKSRGSGIRKEKLGLRTVSKLLTSSKIPNPFFFILATFFVKTKNKLKRQRKRGRGIVIPSLSLLN